MGKLSILKTLMDIVYFFLLLTAVVIVLIITPDLLTGADLLSAKILAACKLTGILFFVYGIYVLRKTIGYFKVRDFFNVNVIRSFSITGKCFVALSLLEIPIFFYEQDKNHSVIELTLLLCLGLFFMVLSEVFKIAKGMKEENELTV